MANIDGTSGNDTIQGTQFADTVDGKAGDDTIHGDGGADLLRGGDGNDTIHGGAGHDTIDGGDGNDVIFGGSGDSVLRGGKGDDVLTGDNSVDTIMGGEGNDVIDASDGDDLIAGNAGDDNMTGGKGADTFFIRDGDGNDRIHDFRVADGDRIAFDMAEIRSLADLQDRMEQVGKDLIISFDNGSTLTLRGVGADEITIKQVIFNAGPICLLAGTEVRTPRGWVAVEALRRGDCVETVDHGPQPVREIVSQNVHFLAPDDPAKPIRIAPGALGPGRPDRALVLSPQHRVLVDHPAHPGGVLVAAVKLLGRRGVRRMRGRRIARYHNLLLDRHELIHLRGAVVETLLATGYVFDLADPALATLARPDMVPARPILRKDPGSVHDPDLPRDPGRARTRAPA